MKATLPLLLFFVGCSSVPHDAPIADRSTPSVLLEQKPSTARERPASLPQFLPAVVVTPALDPRWSAYGPYLQRMLDTVQIQWERLILGQKDIPAPGTSVAVTFVMNSRGYIPRIENVEGTADELALRACLSAIMDKAPYEAWSEGMRVALGSEQTMKFTFRIQ